MEQQKRFMRLPEVQRTVGLGRSAIYERVAEGSFPAPVPLGGRAVRMGGALRSRPGAISR